jgi:branched-chain amino acid transport system ATP-binding protein
MLHLRSITAGYDDTTVLRNVDFTDGDGEVVALLGPNGAGKTTLLRTASGFVRPTSGRVEVHDEDLTGKPPYLFVKRGVCHLPEGRGVFPSLTVKENLTIQSGGTRTTDDAIAEISDLFPVLGDRLRQTAGSLSGGEQQMLALSRAYLTNPKLVVVDEASLGLAPLIVDRIYEALAQLVRRGMSLVVVEQYAQKALELAKTVYILNKGEVVHTCPSDKINADEIYERYLGLQA